jgi:hypothetical protein
MAVWPFVGYLPHTWVISHDPKLVSDVIDHGESNGMIILVIRSVARTVEAHRYNNSTQGKVRSVNKVTRTCHTGPDSWAAL